MAVRVLWVVKGLGPGGAERLLSATASALEPRRFDIECAYVLPWKDHLVADLERAGVLTHCLSTSRTDPRWPIRLTRLIRNGDFEVVHVHSPLPGAVARIATRTLPAPERPLLVSTEHNSWGTFRWPTRLANRVTSRWDDAAIAVTDQVLSSMRGPARRVATAVRHGIDVDAAPSALADRPSIREELGIGADEIIVGTVANFRAQKDYPNLLQAARILRERSVGVRIVAVGQGPGEAAIRDLHRELALDDMVVLTGFRDDAVKVMAACDIFTLASKWEGLPVAIMEACALGLPIVATAVGGVAEEFEDGVDALLVPPSDPSALADGISAVVSDAGLRRRLSEAANEKADLFDVRHAAQVLETIYDSAPDRRGAHAPAQPAPNRRLVPDGIEVRRANAGDRPAILEMLGRSMGGNAADPRFGQLFEWKHDQNRFGPSPMWVAVDGDRIAGFRSLLRWQFERGGQVLDAVRAVDTATDPDYQGKGLFTTLTLRAVDDMQVDGVDFVFNTPNDQSRPGYLKMGWREVGSLPAAVRFSGAAGAMHAIRSRTAAELWSLPLDVGEHVVDWLGRAGPAGRETSPLDVRQIRTRVDDDFLAWRYGLPLLSYRVVDDGDTAVIVRLRRRGTATELALVQSYGSQVDADRLASRTATKVGADYVIRLGHSQISSMSLPLPGGGPILTWRAVNDLGMPPLSNWSLTLGDIELF